MTGAPWQELPDALGESERRGWVSRISLPVAMTGATGFVGSHVVGALLEGGVRPRLLVRDLRRLDAAVAHEAEVVTGDLGDLRALEELAGGCRTLIHVAGVVRATSARDFDGANRVGVENVVDALARTAPSARLICVSSLAAAGPSSDPQGRGPDQPAEPISAYGASKLAGELAVRRHCGAWAILRPPAIYGPRDIGVLPFFRMAAQGRVFLPAGERWVTMAHVADVVRAVLAAAAGAGEGRVLHLGEPSPCRMDALVGLLGRAGGVPARAVPVPAAVLRVAGVAGDLLHALGWRTIAITSDKARELVAYHWSSRTAASMSALGLAGFVPFAAGARATWAWYRERGWVPHAKIPHV